MRLICQIAAFVIYASMSSVCANSEIKHDNKSESISNSSTAYSGYRRRIDIAAILQNKNEGKTGDRGPKRGKNYDPSIGYEPYWENGDWVFNWFHELSKKNESKALCVPKCTTVYEHYGKICGRNKYLASKTFENYCELTKLDCDGRDGWVIVYRGECRKPLPVHPTLPSSTTTLLRSRATYFIKEFSKRHPHL